MSAAAYSSAGSVTTPSGSSPAAEALRQRGPRALGGHAGEDQLEAREIGERPRDEAVEPSSPDGAHLEAARHREPDDVVGPQPQASPRLLGRPRPAASSMGSGRSASRSGDGAHLPGHLLGPPAVVADDVGAPEAQPERVVGVVVEDDGRPPARQVGRGERDGVVGVDVVDDDVRPVHQSPQRLGPRGQVGVVGGRSTTPAVRGRDGLQQRVGQRGVLVGEGHVAVPAVAADPPPGQSGVAAQEVGLRQDVQHPPGRAFGVDDRRRHPDGRRRRPGARAAGR